MDDGLKLIAHDIEMLIVRLNVALADAAEKGVQVDISVLDLSKLSHKAACRYLDVKCFQLITQ